MTKYEQIMEKLEENQTIGRGDVSSGEERSNIVAQTGMFWNTYNHFYENKMSDEDLMVQTTQTYWQSMKLTKERLKQWGLTMQVERGVNSADGRNKCVRRQNKHNTVEEYVENVKAKRIFYKDGRKIYGRKAKETCQTDFLQSAIVVEEAFCPNCGGVGKVSSYIDGCDYCNSKFTVKELEQKISGFSFREDVAGKLKKFALIVDNVSRVFFTIALIALVPLLIFFALSSDANPFGVGDFLEALVVLGFYTGFVYLFSLGIVSLINMFFIKSIETKYGERITCADIEDSVKLQFSAQDFAENLEWKLKSIMLTSGMERIKTFVQCDVSEVETLRKDVVDSSMTSLHIYKLDRKEDVYEIAARAVMRNYYYRNGKITESSEEFDVLATCKKEVEEHPIWALRQHQCTGCGSSVDVFNGGVCEYCGKEMDYSNVGWIIRNVKHIGRAKSAYPKLAWKLIRGYLIALVISLVLAIVEIVKSGM